MGKRVLMTMSGGIDSSVAALLLRQQGYELVGVTYRTFDAISGACMEKERGCCSVDSIFEAKRMAESLGVEHHILDIRKEFAERVIQNFVDEYLHGRTPNPCVVCNSVIKWGWLIETADQFGCDWIATGHYARIGRQDGRYFLRKGIDKSKDQTYFLWMLTQENLARTLFPLGELTKPEVRALAAAHGYEALSKKRESQEICFIPDNDYRTFLADRIPGFRERFGPGRFVNTSGKYLGEHQGFPYYTIGQRKGLGIALGQPMFVVAIDAGTNEVTLGAKEELLSPELTVASVNRMKYREIPAGLEVSAKIRYRNAGLPASLCPDPHTPGQGRLRVCFHTPAESVTPGQSAVFYEGDDLIGGGIIEG